MKLKTLSDIKDPSRPYVIMMHGYGADAQDLFSLADAIPTKKVFNYIFPEAPISIPLGPHWTGRAWWNIDMNRLQNPSADHDISTEIPAELPKARKLVQDMIHDLKVPTEQIILGGFSQGGMCAVDQMIMSGHNYKGLILLSSALINKAEYKAVLPGLKTKTPYFISHGQQDQVLKVKFSDQLHSMLSQNGHPAERYLFQGGHEIPMAILEKLGAFLDRIDGDSAILRT
jgi:phospholipase/carboxylesterase